MKKIWDWCKGEAVLSIALLLAIVSAFWVQPDKEYLEYIDFGTLAILFCLMAVMAGLQKIGLFPYVAQKLLKKVQHIRGIVFVLITLCFFSSMFITNDVALITFVPFTFIVLKMVLKEQAEKLVIPVVVMQTIAANLGSMMTPIGNPQNLYLYGKTTMNFVEFIVLMLPCTAVAFVLLVAWCFLFPYKGEKRADVVLEETVELGNQKVKLIIYGLLFGVCLLTVAHVLPYQATLLIVFCTVILLDRSILGNVDYILLLTFVGFFVFIGNMGRVPAFNEFLKKIIEGNEILTSVVSSQVMSNVPAALLLSGFTDKYKLLIVGTNLGGLGTIIASMASLISFKYIGKEYQNLKMRYLLYFTVTNILFLVVFLLLFMK